VLEVIGKGSSDSAMPPLLFVHGAWHGAWCWDEHFLDFFAERGFHALALSLRGHGNSANDKRLSRCSIADYVDDVVSVAESLPTSPVVIGHSMGGLIIQKYLESRIAPAGVLLASAPPKGVGAATLRLIKRHPWIAVKSVFTGDTMGLLKTPDVARLSMFSPATPEPIIEQYMKQFQQESKRALYIDAAFTHLPKPDLVSAPLLVLGADDDGAFSVAEVHATARAYRTEAQVFSGMGHDMMLEPGWEAVAARIAHWLTGSLRPLRS
jgi:pimeloyl-ACP methyl ester carboxylesterase